MNTAKAASGQVPPYQSLLDATLDWLAAEVEAPAPIAAGLRDGGAEAGTGVRLLGMTPACSAKGSQEPAHLWCDLLITVAHDDPTAEGDMLASLLAAVLARPDILLREEAAVPSLCVSLGLKPALGCIIRVALPLPVAQAVPVKRVRRPLIAQIGAVRDLSGAVVSADGVPLSGLLVSLDDVRRHARTDPQGRFMLKGLAGDADTIAVTVRGRGTAIRREVPADGSSVTIQLPMEG